MGYINDIIQKAYSGEKLSDEELKALIEIEDKEDIQFLFDSADKLRKKTCGDFVTFVKNRNFNFTNVCRNHCTFCAFKRNSNSPDAFTSNIDELLSAIKPSEITEVCIQGGLNEDVEFNFYLEILKNIKKKYPEIHIHAFSPMEIDFMAEKSQKSITEVLHILKENGLGSMPGTAAEILCDEIRKIICPEKINTAKWIEIIKKAHFSGIPTTATVMFGHIETSEQLARHLSILRKIQEETEGFTEFIPLPFISKNTILAKEYPIESYSETNVLKMYAVCRLYFGNIIKNIQASWVKIGIENVKKSLNCGVNDIGGTLGEEKISKAAGGVYGESLAEKDLRKIIISSGKIPVQRNTLYQLIDYTQPSSFAEML